MSVVLIPPTPLNSPTSALVQLSFVHTNSVTIQYTLQFFNNANIQLVAFTFNILPFTLTPFGVKFTLSQNVLNISATSGPQNSYELISSTFDPALYPLITQFGLSGDANIQPTILFNGPLIVASSSLAPLPPLTPDPFAFWFAFAGLLIMVALIAALIYLLDLSLKSVTASERTTTITQTPNQTPVSKTTTRTITQTPDSGTVVYNKTTIRT